MGDAKQLIVKPISAQDANRIIRQLHYSGKVVNNSQIHFGVFMGDKCGGAMQFGPSLDKRKMLGLVTGTLWNEFIEMNRMMADLGAPASLGTFEEFSPGLQPVKSETVAGAIGDASYSQAASDQVRSYEIKMAAAKTEEDRKQAAKDTDVIRINLLYAGEEAKVVKAILGDAAAARVLAFCTTAILPTMEQHQVIAAAVATLQKRENDAAMTSGRALELICADYIAGA